MLVLFFDTNLKSKAYKQKVYKKFVFDSKKKNIYNFLY